MSAPRSMPKDPQDIAPLGYRNIGFSLSASAARWPDQIAIAAPERGAWGRKAGYRCVTFAELERDTNQLAAALRERGLKPGMRVVLMVKPGIDFIAFTFALFKAGAVIVLIDPGMGGRHMLSCLQDVAPDGFVAIPLVHLIRSMFRHRFPQARLLVTVGRRWGWSGCTARELRSQPVASPLSDTIQSDADAAIIFTTGSTGPPKGVGYTHGNFCHQVLELQERYDIHAGEIDVPCFPLFALFNLAMGVTTVLPVMDATRPAKADPRNIVRAIQDWQATQSFASPAVWNVVGRFCESHQVRLDTLRRVLSAGAPVPAHVLHRMQHAMHPEGNIYTPYGATESLPVASISGREVLDETQPLSDAGAGICVGKRFPRIRWKVIRVEDGPLPTLADTCELERGEVGELIVQGPVVTRAYVTRRDQNELAKIQDGASYWHRMGDLGYLDEHERFWFCGRKAHRVQTSQGDRYSVPCESIANVHSRVYRSALVGIGTAGRQTPALVVECWPEQRIASGTDEATLRDEIYGLLQAHAMTRSIPHGHILFRRELPVDIRHNAKIFREKLAPWAAQHLGS